MASNYPGSLDSFDTIASDKKTSDAVGGRTHRQMHNDLGDAIESVQTELGTNPSGSDATVAARLSAIEAGTNLATGAVTSAKIADGTIATGDLADSAVTLPKIADDLALTFGRSVELSTAGSVGTLSFGDGIEQELQPRPDNGIFQLKSLLVGVTAVNASSDELAPVQFTRKGAATQWLAGNHYWRAWRIAAGSLTTADIGKVWSSGANRITLVDVADGNADFSIVHDDGLTTGSLTAPTGTYTGSPSNVDMTSCTAASIPLTEHVEDSGVLWDDGEQPMFWRRVVQRVIAWDVHLAAQQASVGTKVDLGDVSEIVVLTSDWRWPGDQPAVALVDVTLQAVDDVTVTQWSGLQVAASSGAGSEEAVVGVTADHGLVTWVNAPGYVTTPSDKWADGIPPHVGMTRHATEGGVAAGIFATSGDRALLSNAIQTNTSSKMYPIALGPGNGTLSAGDVAWVRGWRSISPSDSDRHLHVVTDPVTGVTRWYLMAGSTGTVWHSALHRLQGRRLTQTRGTAAVSTAIDADGVTVTADGWAEGTVESRSSDGSLAAAATNTVPRFNSDATLKASQVSIDDDDNVSGVGTLTVAGLHVGYTAKTSAYTATVSDDVIDVTSGTFTLDLPAASTCAGKALKVRNTGTGVVTLDGNSSETVGEVATFPLGKGSYLEIVSTGSAWIVTGGTPDTGWRNIDASLINSWAGSLRVRRVGSLVEVRGALDPSSRTSGNIWATPTGFRSGYTTALPYYAAAWNGSAFVRMYDNGNVLASSQTAAAVTLSFSMFWSTGDAWPTSLPGSAA